MQRSAPSPSTKKRNERSQAHSISLRSRHEHKESDDRSSVEQVSDKKRIDPVLFLPYETAAQVFSLMEKKDCMNAMVVSKHWRERVPSLSTKVWHTVELAGFTDALDNKSLHLCLGPHVKRVKIAHFHEEDAHFGMLRVLQNTSCIRLTELCFDMCQIVDQSKFIMLMEKLAQQLTKLVFLEHDHDLASLPLLARCPKLLHFTLKAIGRYSNPGNTHIKDPRCAAIPDIKFNLTYLCLGAALDRKSCLIPILHRCPELRCLRVGVFENCHGALTSYSIRDDIFISDLAFRDYNGYEPYSDNLLALDLSLVLRLCPYMQYLEFNNHVDDEPSWIKYETFSKKDVYGLKLFKLHSAYGHNVEQIVSVIKDHRSTLEQLTMDLPFSTAIEFESWSNGLKHVCFPNLYALSCGSIYCSGQTLASIIEQCHYLKQVTLTHTGDNIHPIIIHALSKLASLEYLCLYYSHDEDINYHDGALYGLLRKHVDLGIASSLRTIQLNCCDEAILILIGSIQNLRAIHFADTFEDCSPEALLEFAKAMITEHNKVETLEIGEFILTADMVRYFVKMKYLTTVDISSCIVDDLEIELILGHAKMLKYVRLAEEDGVPRTYAVIRKDDSVELVDYPEINHYH